MKENNNINGVANNNINNKGGSSMTRENMTMDIFAEMVRGTLEHRFGDVFTFEVHKSYKNNGLCLTAVVPVLKDSCVAPAIYLEKYFEDYKVGRDFGDIISEIYVLCQNRTVIPDISVDWLGDYEKIQGNICYMLINTEKNKAMLGDIPHTPFLDLSIVYYVLLDTSVEAFKTVPVNNCLLKMWDVDVDSLHKVALQNTQKLLKGRVASIISVIMEGIAGAPEKFALQTYTDVPSEIDPYASYIATNHVKQNGAAVMLYDDLLLGFGNLTGTDFYILPSSVHELVLMPDIPGTDVNYLRQMVSEVNAEHVRMDEFLSENVYHYNRKTGLVEFV